MSANHEARNARQEPRQPTPSKTAAELIAEGMAERLALAYRAATRGELLALEAERKLSRR
jgi:hypothetical protein